ncbi:hypothetical protein SAMN05421863_11243 [Nitrosomonas communis]|jgi:hypothetical protein|uniref:Uncharacterized protein n=1 Tax=Nitrosomonas communis TaxID=44574 RepID=A0A1I4WXV1_9PROT|nr:hypothetical protein SAMN05421863_11243 [Nitrosomonas communis]
MPMRNANTFAAHKYFIVNYSIHQSFKSHYVSFATDKNTLSDLKYAEFFEVQSFIKYRHGTESKDGTII